MIPEESDKDLPVTVQGDDDEVDTIPYAPGESEDEQFNMAIDDTSEVLSFNPKTTDVDKHIDLINTLFDMVDQKEESRKEKFIETMPTMIQTHLIMCKD